MGLDMYLSRRLYVKRWEHIKDNFSITVKKGGKKYPDVNPERISHIIEEVMYWRKANAIHKWFVDNVQGEEDNCAKYYVTQEQLIELRDLCKQVLDTATMGPGKVHAGTSIKDGEVIQHYMDSTVVVNADKIHELLPTQSGCFFGSTDYDQWYIDSIAETYTRLCELNLDKPSEWDYYYRSSW